MVNIAEDGLDDEPQADQRNSEYLESLWTESLRLNIVIGPGR